MIKIIIASEEFREAGIYDSFILLIFVLKEKLKDKFEAGDKEKIEAAVQEALDWLDKNQLAEKDEFEAKQKELKKQFRHFRKFEMLGKLFVHRLKNEESTC